MAPTTPTPPALTPFQRAQFLEHGWVRIEGGVPPANIAHFSENVWVRLGYDPDDKSTWQKEKIHMPRHRQIPTAEFMPKAWAAICEIVGGEERIDKTLFESCGDSLIVNLGTEEWETRDILPKDFGNWHIDGDWFTHFLDSGEQAVQLIVLFNDIAPRAGGTWIAPDGIANVVNFLYKHPEGIDSTNMPTDADGSRGICDIQHCSDFVELTGKAGDVIILHHFMPHSASLVEQKILRTLGVEALPDWQITGARRRYTPTTRAGKDAMIMQEVERLKAHARETGGVVDSMHIDGPVPYQVVTA
ncbi:hypothetical protein FA95DRAFT_1565428 [Auriscalpium vulgare]|uniref:Uncharacterized protein n=1 Tax=Auriscalpium vulgare TaxID=40419 RepID=A0ACB8RBG7_9AGAM|nr:hypothetical protein FA95DRAFT_1565428 [Auriscalpium vulgare]